MMQYSTEVCYTLHLAHFHRDRKLLSRHYIKLWSIHSLDTKCRFFQIYWNVQEHLKMFLSINVRWTRIWHLLTSCPSSVRISILAEKLVARDITNEAEDTTRDHHPDMSVKIWFLLLAKSKKRFQMFFLNSNQGITLKPKPLPSNSKVLRQLQIWHIVCSLMVDKPCFSVSYALYIFVSF